MDVVRKRQETLVADERRDKANMGAHWRGRVALVVFLAIAGFFVVTEHRAHFFGVLPYMLLLLCPALHLWMHRGHGHADGGPGEDQ